MSNWNVLIDESALASVLPEAYARYRPPVRSALATFLAGLPPADQGAVLADQAALPWNASPERRLSALARSCPALQKLGQVAARDRRLSAEVREHLQALESLPASVPLEAIRETLDRELGPLEARGVTLLPPAIAEASVAVVIPFRYDRPPSGGPAREGVFKLLKPGIEERLDHELRLLEAVGTQLDARCDEFRIPHLDYQDAFEQVRSKLRQEIRLDLEQQHLRRARAFFRGDPKVLVPEPFPELCTSRVTAMERATGVKVTDHRLDAEPQRRKLAGLVVAALIARPVFSTDPDTLIHGDPHAGNLFLTDDGRLAVLDWSLVGTLSEHERASVVQMMLGALTLDPGHIVNVLEGLAERHRCDRVALTRVVRRHLKRVRRGHFPGFGWLLGLLDDAAQEARLRVGADLMLFRKSLHTLEGVLADIGGGDDHLHAGLLREFLRRFVAEWPRRWVSLPGSRAFRTRLSNADLTHLLASVPLTAARFLLEEGLDLIHPKGAGSS